jgi:uncharacterized protein
VNEIAALLRQPDTIVAVVGASDDPEKYGNIIYLDLRARGIAVRAVNPYRDTVAGDPCWRSLADLPEPPTIVNIVVPPTRTLAVLEVCDRLGWRTVWIQPGAADDAVRQFVADHGFTALVDACIMVGARAAAGGPVG